MNGYDTLAKAVNPEFTGEGIKKIINDLPRYERELITALYGLDGGKPMTEKEICEKFNIREDDEKALFTDAIRKLRHPTRRQRALGK